jgi:hypothetical protein
VFVIPHTRKLGHALLCAQIMKKHHLRSSQSSGRPHLRQAWRSRLIPQPMRGRCSGSRHAPCPHRRGQTTHEGRGQRVGARAARAEASHEIAVAACRSMRSTHPKPPCVRSRAVPRLHVRPGPADYADAPDHAPVDHDLCAVAREREQPLSVSRAWRGPRGGLVVRRAPSIARGAAAAAAAGRGRTSATCAARRVRTAAS